MWFLDADTIAATATPQGAAGIGVVKISGPKAISSAFSLLRPSRDLSRLKSHHLYHGYIIDPETEKAVDEVLYAIMRAPHTYTREDVVEIQAHGSRCGLHKILELVLRQGVRLAEPGEFTKRAFLNGRIDLTQAEAVAEVISAQTPQGLELATQQLKGNLHEAIYSIRKSVEAVLVDLEAAIDFPEDVEDIIQAQSFAQKMAQDVIRPLEELLAHYEEGHVYREGIAAIIVGRPNVGKSSLMNRLLQKERAIVTTIPGTTRDFIEETVNIKGISLRLIDTAGLHDTDDALEAIGIRLTRQRLDEADLVLFMVDGSRPLTAEDSKIYHLVQGQKAILVVNKKDLPSFCSLDEVVKQFPGPACIAISALYNEGIEPLKAAVFAAITDQQGPVDLPAIVPNVRHKVAIEKAITASMAAEEGFSTGQHPELIAIDLRGALDSLGEIIGVTTPEDILGQIFSQFCIGK
jgi:tRNA modification GTPase